ncbi:MAG: response regulator [Myxococcaceae bacterium]|nr:response regulator [Myxococcaceae bacterium]MCI0670895.1 response regulator [Myxococcaceae bacterium]
MARVHVLVIEDDPDMREVISYALEVSDIRVSQAVNGREGLARLEQELPDLILLDMRMPVMDGWRFAEELHRRYDDQVPVVVCTAANDAERRAREVGAVGVLAKPFELEGLLRQVELHARPRVRYPVERPAV